MLPIAATALLLASCDTVGPPQDDPYAPPPPYPGDAYPPQPYPPAPYPPQPYPPAPYPPQTYPPQTYPPAPYPPGAPYPPAAPVEACPIESSRNWRAWVTTEPGPPPRSMLTVTGTVVAPTGGYRIEFVPELTVIKSYPVQMVAQLLPIAPQGPATQALVAHNVRWQWPLAGPVGTVAIRCGDKTLANISAVGSN